VIDVDDIRLRWQQAETFLDERGRRLLAANEALAHGYGGVSAVARATGLARSTINRGIRELRLGRNEIGSRVRRAGGGRKSAVAHQPDLPAALETLIEDAIRGDPCSPLRWVSRNLRHLVKALAAQGFRASQRVVANLLRQLNYSCQANRKTREGANHPDRDAQFAHINATVKAAMAAGEPATSVDTKKKELVGDFKRMAASFVPRAIPNRCGCMTSRSRNSARSRHTGPTTLPPIMAGSASASTPIPGHLPSKVSDAGGASSASRAIRTPSVLPHGGLRRQQWPAGQAMEARTAALRQ